MLKKRFLTALLSLSMVLGLSAPALAVEVEEAQVEAAIEAEVRAMEEEVYADVYRQLEEQDGLHMMDTYKAILGPRIRAAVEEKYVPVGYSTMSANATFWTRTAYNGGTAKYTMLGNVKVTETYMKPAVTRKLLRGELEEFGPSAGQTVMEDVLRAVHEVLDTSDWNQLCAYLSISATLRMITVMKSFPEDAIADADDYAYVIATEDPTMPAEYAVTVAWFNHPTIKINKASLITDVTFKAGA